MSTFTVPWTKYRPSIHGNLMANLNSYSDSIVKEYRTSSKAMEYIAFRGKIVITFFSHIKSSELFLYVSNDDVCRQFVRAPSVANISPEELAGNLHRALLQASSSLGWHQYPDVCCHPRSCTGSPSLCLRQRSINYNCSARWTSSLS
jgi:hypothetical protein